MRPRKLKGEGKYLFEFGIVDVNMLRRQKYTILKMLERRALTTRESDAIEGIVNLLESDAGIFMDAARAAGIEVTFREVHQDPTPIRDYPHYTPGS